MAKQNWGVKHTCLGCGAKFYDMGQSPISCPACGEPLKLSAPGRTRRRRKAAAKEELAQSSKKANGVVADEAEILPDEVESLIDEEEDDEDIVNLTADDEDEDADVLVEADIDTSKIADE